MLFISKVQPAKSNHLGKIPKVVALCRWLLFAGSVMIISRMSNLYIMVEFKTYNYVNMFFISYTTKISFMDIFLIYIDYRISKASLKSCKSEIRSFFKTTEVLFPFHSPKLTVDFGGIALYSGVSVMSLKI